MPLGSGILDEQGVLRRLSSEENGDKQSWHGFGVFNAYLSTCIRWVNGLPFSRAGQQLGVNFGVKTKDAMGG